LNNGLKATINQPNSEINLIAAKIGFVKRYYSKEINIQDFYFRS